MNSTYLESDPFIAKYNIVYDVWCVTTQTDCYISGLLQPELYTTFLASIMFFHSIAKAQHREQGKHLSTIIGGIYLLSLQLDSIYTTQRDNTVR